MLVEELQYARDDARVGQQALVSEPARLVQLRAAQAGAQALGVLVGNTPVEAVMDEQDGGVAHRRGQLGGLDGVQRVADLALDERAESLAATALQPALTRACARYLLEAKRGARALDPVANFHLTNGARVERLNWLGDTSEQGMKQSAGLMVNYEYDLDDVEENHESYSGEGKIAAATVVVCE